MAGGGLKLLISFLGWLVHIVMDSPLIGIRELSSDASDAGLAY